MTSQDLQPLQGRSLNHGERICVFPLDTCCIHVYKTCTHVCIHQKKSTNYLPLFHHICPSPTGSGLVCLQHLTTFWHLKLMVVLKSVLPYISVYKSRNLSQNKVLHRQFVLYTGNTLREEIIPKASWIFKVRAQHDWAVVSDNAWIDEYSIAPLIYHLYTNQFLCYSWDIIL